MNITNYQNTKYPKIYIKTYWGSFDNNSNNYATQEIIDNRNKFILEYNIKNVTRKPPKYIHKIINPNLQENKKLALDHVEIYKTHDDKFILISSIYSNNTQEYINQGWNQLYNLYTNDSYTYVKIV